MATPREIPQRELRNRVSEVLREVADGRTLRVTVRGRAVADLVPVRDGPRRRLVPRATLERILEAHEPDDRLAEDVESALGQTVDELR